VDWDSDAFVLANLRNVPSFPRRISPGLIDRVLATGRAAILEDAYADICPFDMSPCDADPRACAPGCDRVYAHELYGRARAALFVSPAQRDRIAAVVGALPERQIIIRPPIDPDRFRLLGLERDIDVLYVGTISASKGYENLLGRFGPERLTFVGPNALGRSVEGRWLGVVSNSDLPAVYNRARTFAHLPQWFEPMGRTPVEAALCGCELILNDRVGVTSHRREEWSDPVIVRRNPDRFWEDFEAAFD
jgi:glycosyltransferase involved in cell wall biosynthesis